jgi:hypothetical protein
VPPAAQKVRCSLPMMAASCALSDHGVQRKRPRCLPLSQVFIAALWCQRDDFVPRASLQKAHSASQSAGRPHMKKPRRHERPGLVVHWAQPATKCETGCRERIAPFAGEEQRWSHPLTKKTPRVGGV